jgi:hypothetical protein
MLSSSNRAVVKTSLGRMVGNAYGALATLPLYCVGMITTSDPDSIVIARYDVWHSYLVVTREMLRSTSFLERGKTPLDSLFAAVERLRDGFLKLLHARTMNAAAVRIEYKRLASSYRRIASLVEILGQHLELTSPLVPAPDSLKYVVFERSLRWFGKELNKVAGTIPAAVAHQE